MNKRKTKSLKVLRHLHRTPAVKGNFTNVVNLAKLLNEIFDKAVMHNISLRSHDIPLPFPYVIRHMVTADTQVESFFGQPEVRENIIFIIFTNRRKHQHKCRNIGCT